VPVFVFGKVSFAGGAVGGEFFEEFGGGEGRRKENPAFGNKSTIDSTVTG
jgi:hypothetical protein